LLDDFENRVRSLKPPPVACGAAFLIEEDESEAFLGSVRQALE